MRPWFAADGDRTLRLDYDLDESSVVVDVGGYRGQWASDIFGRYRCRVFVFEPMPDFADAIARRFAKNDAVTVFSYGLGGRDSEQRMSVSEDASSVHARPRGADTVPIRLRAAQSAFEELGLQTIDLMKINIEGGEYELLDHMIAQGLVTRVRDIQVQFHDFVDDAMERYRAIRRELEKTHSLTYRYEFVWENWRRDDAAGRQEDA